MDAYSFEFLGYREARDSMVSEAARRSGAIVLTKDADFADDVERNGSPPVLWGRTPNTATRDLKPVLLAELSAALDAVREGVALVEIGRLV